MTTGVEHLPRLNVTPEENGSRLEAPPNRRATRRPSTMQIGKSGRVYISRIDGPCSVNRIPRRWAIKAIEWPWFDRMVLILIVINCCFLAISDPTCALAFSRSARPGASLPRPTLLSVAGAPTAAATETPMWHPCLTRPS